MSRSDGFILGFEKAEREFYEQEEPAFENPFQEGTDEHTGYEKAVYTFTQK